MSRLRTYFAGRYVAQEARRAGQLRHDDNTFRAGGGAFQSAAEVVDTDQQQGARTVSDGSHKPGLVGSTPTPASNPMKADVRFAQVRPASDTATQRVVGPIYPLVALCRAAGLPEPVAEFRFHPVRRYRFDYAFPLHLIAVEIDGGVWSNGRHTRGSGFIEDQRKTNLAAVNGWRVLRYTPDRLGECIADLSAIFNREA